MRTEQSNLPSGPLADFVDFVGDAAKVARLAVHDSIAANGMAPIPAWCGVAEVSRSRRFHVSLVARQVVLAVGHARIPLGTMVRIGPGRRLRRRVILNWECQLDGGRGERVDAWAYVLDAPLPVNPVRVASSDVVAEQPGRPLFAALRTAWPLSAQVLPPGSVRSFGNLSIDGRALRPKTTDSGSPLYAQRGTNPHTAPDVLVGLIVSPSSSRNGPSSAIPTHWFDQGLRDQCERWEARFGEACRMPAEGGPTVQEVMSRVASEAERLSIKHAASEEA